LGAVRETVAAGVDGLKFYVGLDPEWLPAMVEASHAEGRKASMHCLQSGVLVAARAGIDEFFHLDGVLHDVWPDHPPGWLDVWGLPEFARSLDQQQRLADEIARRQIIATPTLAYWDSQWRGRLPRYARSPELRDVPADIVRWQTAREPDPAGSERWKRALEAAQGFISLLLNRRAPVLAGTDVPCGAAPPGLSLWREMRLLAEAGMSNQDAFAAATSKSATLLGIRDVGTLRAGSEADMVLVRGNPLDTIPEQPDIALIVRRGEIYEPDELRIAAREEDADLEAEPWARQFRAYAEGTPAVPWD
jgi:hypothetical protein